MEMLRRHCLWWCAPVMQAPHCMLGSARLGHIDRQAYVWAFSGRSSEAVGFELHGRTRTMRNHQA